MTDLFDVETKICSMRDVLGDNQTQPRVSDDVRVVSFFVPTRFSTVDNNGFGSIR